MVEDTLEDALGDDDESEDAAQEEIDKILFELTAGLLLYSTHIEKITPHADYHLSILWKVDETALFQLNPFSFVPNYKLIMLR